METSEQYSFAVYGPGIQSKIIVGSEEDFVIVDAIVKKLKNKILEQKPLSELNIDPDSVKGGKEK